MGAVRLAGLLAGLSRFADLGFGLEPGSALRSAVVASRLAGQVGLPDADVRAAFYTALLHHVGCVGYAHETATLFGDDLLANAAAARVDAGSPRDVLATFVPRLTQGLPARRRVGLAVTAVAHGGRWGRELTSTACDVGRECARRLDLPVDVQTSLQHVFDLWRGHGREHRVAGDDLPLGARIARLAGIGVLFASIGGPDLAVDAVRRRSGGMLDPALVTPFAAGAAGWLRELEQGDPRLLALDAEPTPWVTTSDIPAVAEVFGDLADLKSPFLLGHSRRVSRVSGRAARRLGLDEQQCRDVVTAGSLHDLGRVAVSSAVWDKPGPLDDDEWEQARLHPYYSERILLASSELASLAGLAGRHHERLDGSGYHRGCTAEALSMPARVLAAADTYCTLTEPRPHRAARRPDEAAARLREHARAGTLDAGVVAAVIGDDGVVAEQTATASERSRLPHGLSAREVEVLRLVASGCSNAEIAARLVISRRTAEHHVQHIYRKVGSSSRAVAALFALEHGLLQGDG